MISLAVGSLLMLSILSRYIYTRRSLIKFNGSSGYGTASGNTDHLTSQSTMPSANMTSGKGFATTSTSSVRPTQAGAVDAKPQHRGGVYDRWLLVRFSIAFVILRYVRR